MTEDNRNLGNSLYEYFNYDSSATKQIQEPYIKFFEKCEKVLDLACGRGEFLELLSERGICGIGIDKNENTCNDIKKRGLDCICDDIFNYLENSDHASVDGIFISHFIEHLEPNEIIKLLSLSNKIMKPNGIMVITTPNVGSLPMQLDYFHRDFSHIKFYHPELIRFFVHYSNFSVIDSGSNDRFWFRSPIAQLPPESELVRRAITNGRLPPKSGLVGGLLDNAHLLEYINIDEEFSKIKYDETKNPAILLKRKLGELLTRYVIGPQLNKIGEIINAQISYTNEQVSYLNERVSHSEKSLREIVAWVDSVHPPSEVYVVAQKRIDGV